MASKDEIEAALRHLVVRLSIRLTNLCVMLAIASATVNTPQGD
jgi:hypothetical protein